MPHIDPGRHYIYRLSGVISGQNASGFGGFPISYPDPHVDRCTLIIDFTEGIYKGLFNMDLDVEI